MLRRDPRSGEGEGFVAASEERHQPPHLPIADAMGPLLSRKGRGDSRNHPERIPPYAARTCSTVGAVPAIVVRRMSRTWVWS
jgi:hypothetical protein